MTLQYGLAMAPASQPRNAIYGPTLAISIAMAFTYIPETTLPLWVRVPLATATAIASLTKLGITHPPAGAATVIISSGGYDWIVLPLILLGNVIAIITATLINNMSDKRQYPTFWHFGLSPLVKALDCIPKQPKATEQKRTLEKKETKSSDLMLDDMVEPSELLEATGGRGELEINELPRDTMADDAPV
jgi:CBS-domain-containing membrane protein